MVRGPKGSEIAVESWLRRRPGITDVRFVGDEGEGPPDFLAHFHGRCVAVEVTKRGCKSGWPEKYRIAFERELRAVVQSVKDDPRAPRWHVLCSYDPCQPKPPNRNGDWKRRLRTALMRSGGGGKIQLIEESLRVGDGVVVEYLAAGNEGSLPFVSEDSGYGMASAASQRIAEEVRRKAAKVRSSPIACNFGGQWWLALDDEVVRLHSALSEWEWRAIRESVGAANEDAEVWSKVILVSERTGNWTTIWERPDERGLS